MNFARILNESWVSNKKPFTARIKGIIFIFNSELKSIIVRIYYTIYLFKSINKHAIINKINKINKSLKSQGLIKVSSIKNVLLFRLTLKNDVFILKPREQELS